MCVCVFWGRAKRRGGGRDTGGHTRVVQDAVVFRTLATRFREDVAGVEMMYSYHG